jgi:hypothetical protein
MKGDQKCRMAPPVLAPTSSRQRLQSLRKHKNKFNLEESTQVIGLSFSPARPILHGRGEVLKSVAKRSITLPRPFSGTARFSERKSKQ